MASLINMTGDSAFMAAGVVGDAGAMVGMMGSMMQKQAADQKAAALKAQGEAQARMYEQDAAQEVAAAQRISIERAYKDRQTKGTAIVMGAASGSSMTSPTITDIMGEIDARDMYGRESDIFQGNEKKRRLMDSAALARYGADIGAAAARAQGTAAMVGGLQGLAKGMGSFSGKAGGDEYASSDTSGWWNKDESSSSGSAVDYSGGWSFDFS